LQLIDVVDGLSVQELEAMLGLPIQAANR